MKPTSEQFLAFEKLFDYYNKNLFDGQLPEVFLNFSRKKNTAGFFSPTRWKHVNGEKKHEISINPVSLVRGKQYVIETLVHEMCHLWQKEFGKPSRSGYHNKEWANKMESVGLIPSSTGQPGGNKTGQNMADYMEEGGKLEKLLNAMPSRYLLPLQSLDVSLYQLDSMDNMDIELTDDEIIELRGQSEQNEKKRKWKYSCPSCGMNLWGKPGLNVICGDCNCNLNPG